MRCMVCGAEMILMNVVQDDTMAVPGFEHRTFMCSSCHDVERRLAFVKQDESVPEALPVHAAPPIVPAEPAPDEHIALPAPGLIRRVVAKLRGWN
jgi:hypothetical protein